MGIHLRHNWQGRVWQLAPETHWNERTVSRTVVALGSGSVLCMRLEAVVLCTLCPTSPRPACVIASLPSHPCTRIHPVTMLRAAWAARTCSCTRRPVFAWPTTAPSRCIGPPSLVCYAGTEGLSSSAPAAAAADGATSTSGRGGEAAASARRQARAGKQKVRLDELCLRQYPAYSRNLVQSWILQGKVRVDDGSSTPKVVTKAGTQVSVAGGMG